MKVRLLYFAGCPNVDGTRENLRRAVAQCGFEVRVEEIDTTDPDTPERLRGWGSPTVLVDGTDVAGASGPAGASCRLYPGAAGLQGAPAVETITAALRRARNLRWSWMRTMASLPATILPLLPSATCPACVAAYAGVLSTLGLGVLLTERALAPLIVGFLFLGFVSVAWATKSHGRYGPLLATVLGSLAVALGRLVWRLPPVLYVGVALLLGATLWNLWLKRPKPVPLIQIGPGPSAGATS